MNNNCRIRKYAWIAILIATLAGTYSCKTKRAIISSPSTIEHKESRVLFADILQNKTAYQTFDAKITLSFINGSSSRSSKATLKIVRNEALQISIQPIFGLEYFRLHIDNDSLTLLDRMNKRYVKESIDNMKLHHPTAFDLNTLQELMTDGIFIAGKRDLEQADYSNFQYANESSMYYLKANDNLSGTEYFFSVNAANKVIYTNLTNPDKKCSLRWSYNDFSLLNDKQIFPYKMNVQIGTPSFGTELGIQFNDIALNNPIDLQVNIPKGYSKISLSEVVKILKTQQ